MNIFVAKHARVFMNGSSNLIKCNVLFFSMHSDYQPLARFIKCWRWTLFHLVSLFRNIPGQLLIKKVSMKILFFWIRVGGDCLVCILLELRECSRCSAKSSIRKFIAFLPDFLDLYPYQWHQLANIDQLIWVSWSDFVST
jgi:hypothetical protein